MGYFLVFILSLIGQSISRHIRNDEAALQVYGGTPVTDSRVDPISTFVVLVLCGNSAFTVYGLCGGTLLGDQWVVLAAHCCMDREAAIVVAGRPDLTDYMQLRTTLGYDVTIDEDNLRLQERRAAQIFIHEEFNETRHDHDVALIRLDRAFQMNDNVSLAALSQDAFPDTATCTIFGWGTSGGLNKYHLMMAQDVTLLSIQHCLHRQEGNYLCVAKSDPPKGICKGDSGSPLLCGGRVSGIASYAYNYQECGLDDEEFYLDTYPYLAWIARTMDYNSSTRRGWHPLSSIIIIIVITFFIL